MSLSLTEVLFGCKRTRSPSFLWLLVLSVRSSFFSVLWCLVFYERDAGTVSVGAGSLMFLSRLIVWMNCLNGRSGNIAFPYHSCHYGCLPGLNYLRNLFSLLVVFALSWAKVRSWSFPASLSNNRTSFTFLVPEGLLTVSSETSLFPSGGSKPLSCNSGYGYTAISHSPCLPLLPLDCRTLV